MTDKTSQLSDLLALRDGEPLDLATAEAIDADPEARAQLQRLRAIKADIRELPDIEPDPDQWQAILAKVEDKKRFALPYPMATAAAVFLAAALSIMVFVPRDELGTPAPAGMATIPGLTGEVQLAGLMDRSQQLESQVAAPRGGWNSSQEALMYRIADIDSQIEALHTAGIKDPERQAVLWTKRVQLLEDLREVQRGQALLRPAVM